MFTPTVYYCYDAYCGWCYGFSPVMQQFWQRHQHQLAFEVLSGGMILPEKPVHISATAPYILSAYQQVEALAGVQFGADYLWHLQNPELTDWYPHSLKPAIALSIIKQQQPHQAVPFAAQLQQALFAEGRDLTDDEAYRHLLPRYQVDADYFMQALHSPQMEEAARYDFALCKQLQVQGYPTVLLQVADTKFYLMAHGYTPLQDLEKRLAHILQEIGAAADPAE